jgi:hypothetical protein
MLARWRACVGIQGAPVSAFKMSSIAFHWPSGCFFQTVTYFPFSVAPLIVI